MLFENLIVEREDGIAVVTLNRPHANHALNATTFDELDRAFTVLFEEPQVRAIVLTGAGAKAFCAGADIEELAACTGETGSAKIRREAAVMTRLERGNKPVIAAVNGFALGGGCELAMACDLRIGSERAVLGQPEVNLGLIPGYGGTQRLARIIGPGLAKWMLFTGERINAQEALKMGLLDFVVPPEDLLPKAKNMAATIAAKPPLAVKYIKRAIVHGADADLTTALEYEATLFGLACASADSTEGCRAFLEKRKPEWSGK